MKGGTDVLAEVLPLSSDDADVDAVHLCQIGILKPLVDLVHDPLGPLDTRTNQLFASRTTLRSAEEIVG